MQEKIIFKCHCEINFLNCVAKQHFSLVSWWISLFTQSLLVIFRINSYLCYRQVIHLLGLDQFYF